MGAFGSTPLSIHGLRIPSLACGVVALALIAFAGMQSFRFGQTLGVTPEGKLSLGSWLALIEVAALAFVCASFIAIVHCRRWLIGLAFAILALPYVLMTTATFIGAATSGYADVQCLDIRARGLAVLIGEPPARIQLFLVAYQAVLITITKVLFIFLAVALWPARPMNSQWCPQKPAISHVHVSARCVPEMKGRNTLPHRLGSAQAVLAGPRALDRGRTSARTTQAAHVVRVLSEAVVARARGPPLRCSRVA
jgi:hypothetical protein